MVHGECDPRPTRRFSAGMVALRPNRDGRIAGYTGVEEIQRRYGSVLDRVALNAPYAADPGLWQQIATDLRR